MARSTPGLEMVGIVTEAVKNDGDVTGFAVGV
jgi:hypothetical protein